MKALVKNIYVILLSALFFIGLGAKADESNIESEAFFVTCVDDKCEDRIFIGDKNDIKIRFHEGKGQEVIIVNAKYLNLPLREARVRSSYHLFGFDPPRFLGCSGYIIVAQRERISRGLSGFHGLPFWGDISKHKFDVDDEAKITELLVSYGYSIKEVRRYQRHFQPPRAPAWEPVFPSSEFSCSGSSTYGQDAR